MNKLLEFRYLFSDIIDEDGHFQIIIFSTLPTFFTRVRALVLVVPIPSIDIEIKLKTINIQIRQILVRL